ncbi:MAG TPA: hypothetical protein ENK91_03855 [Bacteroidetes bacterium]|nr:hypothetical protein [Bacteroidota bacterium]
MKKILLLFVLFLSFNAFAANSPQSSDWVIYFDENGNAEYLDDHCAAGTIISGDDVIWIGEGPC